MTRFHAYQTRFTDARGSMRSLPPVTRTLVTLAAVPGVMVAVIGVAVLLLAVLVLILCVGPTLWLLRAVGGLTSGGAGRDGERPARRAATKQVRSTVIDG